MASNLPSHTIDNIVHEHAFNGLNLKDTALKVGTTYKRVRTALRDRGFVLSGSAKPYIPDLIQGAILELHDAGMGRAGISRWLGYPIGPVSKVITDSGRTLRGRGEQQQARMDASSPEQIASLVREANIAARGRENSFETLCKMAKTREVTGNIRTSVYEGQLIDMLTAKGHEVFPQKAIGPYNCDLVVGTVAVEVFGGHWHWHGAHIARAEERFRYIMDRGYDILVVAITDTYPLTSATGNYVSDLVNVFQSDPPRARQYRVVWGAGKFTTGGSADDDHFSIEPPFTNVRDPATGRYVAVAK